jgi:hypothetical protein
MQLYYSEVTGHHLTHPNGELMSECCCNEYDLMFVEYGQGERLEAARVWDLDFANEIPPGETLRKIKWYFSYDGHGAVPDRFVVEYPPRNVLIDTGWVVDSATVEGEADANGTQIKITVEAPHQGTLWSWYLRVYLILVE